MRTAYILILTLAAGLSARADFSYTSTRKTAGSASDQTTKHYFKGQKMKDDSGDGSTVIDFDAQTITVIDQKAKTYKVTNFGELGKVIPPSDVDVKVDVQKTGEVKQINGYNANEVIFTMDVDNPKGGKMQMETDLWVSADVPGSKEMRAFFEKNGSRFPWAALAGNASPSMQKAIVDLQRQIATLNGVPVLQVMKMKPAGDAAQSAEMREKMEQGRALLEEMVKRGGPQAAAAQQMLDRMGAKSPASGSLFEMTMEFGGFSTAPIPDAVFVVPAGFQRSDKK
jgi:hypothetical protein